MAQQPQQPAGVVDSIIQAILAAHQQQQQLVQQQHQQEALLSTAAMASSLRALQGEVQVLKTNPPANTSAPQGQQPGPRSTTKGRCWYCGILRHHQEECRKRIADGAPLKPRPQKGN